MYKHLREEIVTLLSTSKQLQVVECQYVKLMKNCTYEPYGGTPMSHKTQVKPQSMF